MDYFPTATLSQTSKKAYTTHIIRWLSFGLSNLEELIRDSAKALDLLKKAPVKQTNYVYHGYYSAVVAYLTHEAPTSLKEFKKEWEEIQRTNHKPLGEHYENQEPTEQQKETMIDWKDVLKARDELPAGIERILIAFYSDIPPVRADYNATMLLKPTDQIPEGMNYIILGSEFKLVIQEFKTQKKYKTIEHILPERLKKELEESLKAEPRSWLFIKRRESLSSPEQEMSPGEYSNWANRILTRVFGKRTTLTALRHSFASTLDYNGSLRSLNSIARSMGHSVAMSRGYVWRSSDGPVGSNTVVDGSGST